MYLGEMLKQPYPVGILTSNLMPLLPQLKLLIFRDNEYGAADATPAALSRFVDSTNERLRRAGKSLRVIQLVICNKAHHRIKVIYSTSSTGENKSFEASIYNETRRMKALEKEGGDIDAEHTIGAPRRGAEKCPRKGPQLQKKKKKSRDEYAPHDSTNSSESPEEPTTRRYA